LAVAVRRRNFSRLSTSWSHNHSATLPDITFWEFF
jgi:hypothetical protein